MTGFYMRARPARNEFMTSDLWDDGSKHLPKRKTTLD